MQLFSSSGSFGASFLLLDIATCIHARVKFLLSSNDELNSHVYLRLSRLRADLTGHA